MEIFSSLTINCSSSHFKLVINFILSNSNKGFHKMLRIYSKSKLILLELKKGSINSTMLKGKMLKLMPDLVPLCRKDSHLLVSLKKFHPFWTIPNFQLRYLTNLTFRIKEETLTGLWVLMWVGLQTLERMIITTLAFWSKEWNSSVPN